MKEKHTKITDLLALVVFAVFAVCMMIVLLYGAEGYRNLVSGSEARFESRTAAQYVATRVHQAAGVRVEDFGGCDALVIPEQIEGEQYVTKVYCHEGYIRELFSMDSADLPLEAGEKIMEAESLTVTVAGNLLTVTVDGRKTLLCLRAGEEVPYEK